MTTSVQKIIILRLLEGRIQKIVMVLLLAPKFTCSN